MSDADPSAPAAEPKTRNSLFTLVIMAGCMIAVVMGVIRMTRGLGEMFGASTSAEAEQLVDEANAAFDAAKVHAASADPKFQTLLTAVDAQPLEEVRREHATAGREAEQHYAQAGEQFRLAAKKLDEAATHEMDDKYKAYLAEKSQAYQLLAKVCDHNQEIIRLVLDEAIAYAELEPRVLEIAARRDAAQQEATEIAEQADAAIEK